MMEYGIAPSAPNFGTRSHCSPRCEAKCECAASRRFGADHEIFRPAPLMNSFRSLRFSFCLLGSVALMSIAWSQGVTGTALVRHAPSVSGTVEGSIQQMLPESVTFSGGSLVTRDLLVPGLPTIRLNGNVTY